MKNIGVVARSLFWCSNDVPLEVTGSHPSLVMGGLNFLQRHWRANSFPPWVDTVRNWNVTSGRQSVDECIAGEAQSWPPLDFGYYFCY